MHLPPLLLWALLILMPFHAQSAVFNAANCSGGTYTSQDSFGRSLDQLLLSLAGNVSAAAGFYNSSIVDADNGQQIFGLALCRGDVPSDVCGNCTADARLRLFTYTLCRNKTSGIAWFDECLLRYSDTMFFGIPDLDDLFALYNTKKIFESQDVDVKAMIYPLIQKCAGDSRLFAAEPKIQKDGTVRYGSGQCTRDLNSSQCSDCLNTAVNWIFSNNYGVYNGWRINYGSCRLRYENYSFFQLPLTPPPARPPPPVALPPVMAGNEDNGNKTPRKIAIVVSASIGLLLIGSVLLFLLLKRKKGNEELRRFNSEMTSEMNFSGLAEDERNHELPHFSFKAVQVATDNFSEENKLGRGGFGPVYKGELNGRWVAVKRLSHSSGQGLKEFMIEVVLISKLQHKNLVRLLGCCIEKREKMLIYEFMPNGSLDSFLNDPEKRASLNWEKRFSIIMGTARGLLYLHQDSRLSVIHRDIKAANILLDEHMTAKISDFGTARIFVGDNDAKATNLVVGTYGYMAPEYAAGGLFSVKSDVYSFGVLLLEIIIGQTYHTFHLSPMGHSLTAYAWTQWSNGIAPELIDPKLEDITEQIGNLILRCIHIGLLSIQEDPEQRPTMSIILNLLGSDVALPTPRQPPMVFNRKFTNASSSSVLRSTISSSNTATTSPFDSSSTSDTTIHGNA